MPSGLSSLRFNEEKNVRDQFGQIDTLRVQDPIGPVEIEEGAHHTVEPCDLARKNGELLVHVVRRFLLPRGSAALRDAARWSSADSSDLRVPRPPVRLMMAVRRRGPVQSALSSWRRVPRSRFSSASSRVVNEASWHPPWARGTARPEQAEFGLNERQFARLPRAGRQRRQFVQRPQCRLRSQCCQ